MHISGQVGLYTLTPILHTHSCILVHLIYLSVDLFIDKFTAKVILNGNKGRLYLRPHKLSSVIVCPHLHSAIKQSFSTGTDNSSPLAPSIFTSSVPLYTTTEHSWPQLYGPSLNNPYLSLHTHPDHSPLPQQDYIIN